MAAETTIQVERSEIVKGEPSRLWALMSSPAVWCLRPVPVFMFAVPGAPALRFYLTPVRRGASHGLFEISDELPGTMIRFRTWTGRQEFTLTVSPGRRRTAKTSIQIKEIVPSQAKIAIETSRRNVISSWLSAVRAVIEYRAPWPGGDMSPDLRQRCMARPLISDAMTASASALISADPATVWEAVHSPETARLAGPVKAIYSGYVPATPQGEAGEMQFFVSQRDGQLAGQVAVLTEIAAIAGQRSAVVHTLGPPPSETSYVLTFESASGPARLEVTHRWSAPKAADAAEAIRARMAEFAGETMASYKSLIETGSI